MAGKRRRRPFRSYFRSRARPRRRKGRKFTVLTTVPAGIKALYEPLMGDGEYEGFIPAAQAGNPQGGAYNAGFILMRNFTGYRINDGGWDFMKPVQTYAMILAGIFGHKLATRFGVNNALDKIPIIGKYLAL